MTSSDEIKRHVDWSLIGVFGTLLTMLIQTGGIIWWASSINERVAANERKLAAADSAAATLARLDERTAAIQVDTSRIYTRVDNLERRGDR